jgi:hypothetical protein
MKRTWFDPYLLGPMRATRSTATISKVSFHSIDAVIPEKHDECIMRCLYCPHLWGMSLMKGSDRNGAVRYWLVQKHYLFFYMCQLPHLAHRTNETVRKIDK